MTVETNLGKKPTFEKGVLNVIGVEAPESDAEMMGVRRLVASAIPNREHWMLWDAPNGKHRACQPSLTGELEFSGSRIIHLSPDKGYRAFRVEQAYVMRLLGCSDISEATDKLLMTPSLCQYIHDPNLRAYYHIFDDAETAEDERTKWADLIQSMLVYLFTQKEAQWDQLEMLLGCYEQVISITEPHRRAYWSALTLAMHRVHPSAEDSLVRAEQQFKVNHPGSIDQELILADAAQYEKILQQGWQAT